MMTFTYETEKMNQLELIDTLVKRHQNEGDWVNSRIAFPWSYNTQLEKV